MRKDIKEVMKYAEALGWEQVRMTSTGHYLVRHRVTKVTTTIPATPNGGKRGLKNCMMDLKRWSENPR
jgi:predicted RNA binding protein YcfA (HicA-like mRNA interferase family)